MAVAGKKTTIEISADAGVTWNVISGINDIGDFSPMKDVLDNTAFGTSGAKSKIVGLQDLKLNPKGDRIKTDAGQTACITAFDSETTVRLRILPDGVNGWTVDGIVPGYKVGSQVAGKVAFDFNFEATAKPTAI